MSDDAWAVIAVVFVGCFFLAVLISNNINHRLNVERDKFYADHCKTVEQQPSVLGNVRYECVPAK